jgi:fructose-1,6-bisphosphatase
MEEGMSKKGMEVAETRNVKVKQIRRAIELLKHKLDSDYIERVEAELGPVNYTNFLDEKNWKKLEGGNYELIDTDTPEEKKHGRKVFKRAHKLEQEEWKELWTIIKGNKFTTWEKFDGTDLRNWWD